MFYAEEPINFIPACETFAASLYMSKFLPVRSLVQYPYVYSGHTSAKNYIFSNGQLPGCIIMSNLEQLNQASVYVHFPNNEYSNYVIPLASSLGITVVTSPSGCIPELLTPFDIIVPSGSDEKKWIQSMRIAMRDADKNEMKIKGFAAKWSNLDILAEKVKARAHKKATAKAIVKEIFEKPGTQIIEERAVQAVSKKVTRKQHQMVYPKAPYVDPSCNLMAVPHWFNNENPVRISIIIPMFRSFEEIADQIRNWDLTDPISYEIIYVNDCCPVNSNEQVINSWNRLKSFYEQELRTPFKSNIGRIAMLSHNCGYPTACNIGSNLANGEILVFLNADTIPTPMWLSKLVEPFSDDKVGIVGNMQLKSDGSIDSAGSEWMRDSRTFEHIGRNVHKKNRVARPIHISQLPVDLQVISEREMVTGCCFAIPKRVFEEVGKFDIGYRVGYWEDSDLNMKVKEKGYKILFQPASVIYHKGGHAKANFHPFMADNANLFYDKWLRNGKLEKLLANDN